MTDPLSITFAAAEAGPLPALCFSGRERSFAELSDDASRLGAALARRGIGASDRVAVRARNRPEVCALLLAMIDRGVPFVPVHPRLTPAEAGVIEREPEATLSIDDAALDELLREAASSSGPAPPSANAEQTTLAMLFTSGTTGTPKGAILSRRAFVSAARASEQNLGWRPGDRWLLCLPLCHVGGLSIVTRCLVARVPAVLLPSFDPAEVLSIVAAGGATLLSVVPTMLHRLLDDDRENALSRLRAVLVGGAGCPASSLEECARRGVPALTTYGLTEACSQVTSQRPRDPSQTEPGSGVALPGTRVWVEDETGEVLPSGNTGRIVIDGPTLMDGYFRRPPRVGPHDTGDLGLLDDRGRLFIQARRTDLIVTGGENVYPAEVEQALLAGPAVREAVVFGVADPVWGQLVAAALVTNPGFDPRSLASHCESTLARHKRPRLYAVVDALPLKGPGKIDRAGAAAAFSARLVGLAYAASG